MGHPHACSASLRQVCRSWGRSAEDTEDLIQEALLRLEEYRLTAEVRDRDAFLARTVRNLATDRYRRESLVNFASGPIEAVADSVVDPSPTPDRVLDGEQCLNQIRKALDAVSRRMREIYFLRLAGYAYAEIAELFGLSVATVEKEIARAAGTLVSHKLTAGGI